ncbi:MAG: helix-turn-helix domain-containing protein [Streptosporangiales bacterium]|nr:helix-turn-helix domain-containing protein [Streptosporangiales bacterium]
MTNVLPFTARQNGDDGAEHAELAAVLRMTNSPAVFTVHEVAHLLSLSPGSTYQLCRSGEIPALKLGNRWVIPKRRFHAWLDNLPTADPDEEV